MQTSMGAGAEQKGVPSAGPRECRRTCNGHRAPLGLTQMLQGRIAGTAAHPHTCTKMHCAVHSPRANLTACDPDLSPAGLQRTSAWPRRQLRGRRIEPRSRTRHLSPATLPRMSPAPRHWQPRLCDPGRFRLLLCEMVQATCTCPCGVSGRRRTSALMSFLACSLSLTGTLRDHAVCPWATQT